MGSPDTKPKKVTSLREDETEKLSWSKSSYLDDGDGQLFRGRLDLEQAEDDLSSVSSGTHESIQASPGSSIQQAHIGSVTSSDGRNYRMPTDKDILCERGSGIWDHPGGDFYDKLILSKRMAYINGNKQQKKDIVSEIATTVRRSISLLPNARHEKGMYRNHSAGGSKSPTRRSASKRRRRLP